MRKVVSLSLIWIFLFNVIGYYGIYAGLMHLARSKADHQIETNTYDRAETITIKIPLSLPYPVENGFERLSGDFEYQGQFYELVEQKYEQDTVYVVCLRNHDGKKAQEVLESFASQATDQSPPANQSAKALTGPIKDFNSVIEEITLAPLAAILLEMTFASPNGELPILSFPVLTPPPNPIG